MNQTDWINQGSCIKESYKVPQNYFDTFTERLMHELPEREPVSHPSFILRHLRTVISTAAAIVLLIGAGITLRHSAQVSQLAESQIATASAEQEEQMFDDMLDYTTLSTNEILSCLQESDL